MFSRYFRQAAYCLLLAVAVRGAAVDFAPLDAMVQAGLKANQIPGCAVAVALNNEVIYNKGFGIANVDTKEPVRADMLFRLGSTTKMFTAATLLSLVEEGKVKLDVPIGEYISGLNPKLARVTAHQLLTHTAGLGDANAMNGPHDEDALGRSVRGLKESLSFVEPGRIYSYSNPGYWTAGFLAEVVGGKLYADLVEQRVLKPCGMVRSTFRPTMAVTWPLAIGHEPEGRAPPKVIRPLADNAGVWPAGQLFATAPEFARFCMAFMNGGTLDGKRALSTNVIAQLSAPHVKVAGDDRFYGYGLSVRDEDGLRWLSHTGSRTGYGSIAKMCPEKKFAVIILCNKTGANLARAADKAAELVLNLPASPEPSRKRLSMSSDETQSLAGDYGNVSGRLRLVVRDGKLVNGGGIAITKVGEHRYLQAATHNAPATEFTAIPGDDGKIEFLMRKGRALKRQP